MKKHASFPNKQQRSVEPGYYTQRFQHWTTYFQVLLLLMVLVLNSCTCHSNQDKPTAVSAADSAAQLENKALRADSMMVENPTSPDQFDTSTRAWLSASLGGKQVKKGDFDLTAGASELDSSSEATGTFGPATEFTPKKDFYKDYAPVLRWSPDSSHLVDFGSYGQVVVRDASGKTSLEGGEPDTKVELINPKSGTQSQVLFGGPGLQVLNVKWISKQTFVLLYTNTVHTQPDTLIMIADVDGQVLRQYQLK